MTWHEPVHNTTLNMDMDMDMHMLMRNLRQPLVQTIGYGFLPDASPFLQHTVDAHPKIKLAPGLYFPVTESTRRAGPRSLAFRPCKG